MMFCYKAILDSVIIYFASIQNEPEVMDATYTQKYASYLDLHLAINSRGRLKTQFCDKIEERRHLSKK
jgi:hypothetical protein